MIPKTKYQLVVSGKRHTNISGLPIQHESKAFLIPEPDRFSSKDFMPDAFKYTDFIQNNSEILDRSINDSESLDDSLTYIFINNAYSRITKKQFKMQLQGTVGVLDVRKLYGSHFEHIYEKLNTFDYDFLAKRISSLKNMDEIKGYIEDNLVQSLASYFIKKIDYISSVLEPDEIPIKEESLKYSVLFSKRYVSSFIPSIELANDGNLQIVWNKGERSLIIAFEDAGLISVSYTLPSSEGDGSLNGIFSNYHLKDFLNESNTDFQGMIEYFFNE